MTSTQGSQGPATRTISEDEAARTGIDTTVPHSARVWNYVLGGKDNYAVDRAAGDGMIAALPSIVAVARGYRQFIARSAQVALEAGCRQFIDVGTGLPTANSTHLLVQAQAPEAKVVYVDNDPLVLVHAKALLTSTPEGRTDYIDADMHDPERIIEEARRTLDLSQPVMVTFTGVLGHAETAAQAADICHRLVAPLASGSWLGVAEGVHGTDDEGTRAADAHNDAGGVAYYVRSPEEIATFFEGMELVEPGIVPVNRWRADPVEVGTPQEPLAAVAGLARKP